MYRLDIVYKFLFLSTVFNFLKTCSKVFQITGMARHEIPALKFQLHFFNLSLASALVVQGKRQHGEFCNLAEISRSVSLSNLLTASYQFALQLVKLFLLHQANMKCFISSFFLTEKYFGERIRYKLGTRCGNNDEGELIRLKIHCNL